VFLRLVAEMRDRFLEQRINIKFCVKIGKDANDTCAMLSERYRGEAMKKSSVFEWHKRFRESSHVEIINECSSLSSISRVLFTLNSFHKANLSTKLIVWTY
jgi:hypothetical protein